jgi:hypothetical protein
MNKRQEILSRCKVQPYDKHKFILLEDFEYNGYTVPKGYITDGASIPRIFWSFYPPNRPDYLPAAIVHDHLCDLERYVEGDREFKNCLDDLDIHDFTMHIFHKTVVSYHYIRYYLPNKIKSKIRRI